MWETCIYPHLLLNKHGSWVNFHRESNDFRKLQECHRTRIPEGPKAFAGVFWSLIGRFVSHGLRDWSVIGRMSVLSSSREDWLKMWSITICSVYGVLYNGIPSGLSQCVPPLGTVDSHVVVVARHSKHCKEFPYLKLCRPAYLVRTQLLPPPGQE